MDPAVSVVITTFNRARSLQRALESVLAQTFRDYEVIVVNDGSTDATASLLLGYGDRIRVVSQENRGIGPARNRAMDEARGRYVAFLDDDDWWHPDKLAVQLEFMASHPGFVGCSVPFCFSHRPSRSAFDPAIGSGGRAVEQALRTYAAGHLFVLNSAMMLDMERAGDLRFEAERETIEDIALHVRMLLRGPYGIAGDRLLATYTVHDSNSSRSASRLFHGMRRLRQLQAHGGFGPCDPGQANDIDALLAALGRNMLVSQASVGERRRAIGAYVAEFRHQLRQRRFKFISLFPLMLLVPASLLNRVPSFRSTR